MTEFGDRYQRITQDFPSGVIALDTDWVSPAAATPGTYVVFLPLDPTEREGDVPRIGRIKEVTFSHDLFTIQTTLGLMVVGVHEKIQVIR
jgi:hypothetical protein